MIDVISVCGRSHEAPGPVVVVTAQAKREPNVIQVVPLIHPPREFSSEVHSGEGSGLDQDSNAQRQHIRQSLGRASLRRRGNVGSVVVSGRPS